MIWLIIYLFDIYFLSLKLATCPLRDFAIYLCRCKCRLACVQTSDFFLREERRLQTG